MREQGSAAKEYVLLHTKEEQEKEHCKGEHLQSRCFFS